MPRTPLATPAFLGWPFGLAMALKCIVRTNVTGPFWDYKNHNAGYCLSHELRLVAFVPTSLPWVFFSLVVGHLDLIGNQSRWYMCVGLIPIWSTYWDFFYPAACVNGWKIIFLLYSSGSKFTITSLLSKWVYLNIIV